MATMLLLKHKDKFSEDVIHRLERIQKNVQVETDLISELLELSRIKTRRQTMERVDTETIVKDLEGVLEEDIRSKQIRVILDTALPRLTAERARIRQIFQNLIDNAIKYMGEDRPDEAKFTLARSPCRSRIGSKVLCSRYRYRYRARRRGQGVPYFPPRSKCRRRRISLVKASDSPV